MKKSQWILPVLFMGMLLLFAFVKQQDTGAKIRGRVTPYNAALKVWAVSDNDTSVGVVQNGQFEIKSLKPGRYRVIAEGLRPYKVTTKPDVVVNAGATVDVGEIILDQ